MLQLLGLDKLKILKLLMLLHLLIHLNLIILVMILMKIMWSLMMILLLDAMLLLMQAKLKSFSHNILLDISYLLILNLPHLLYALRIKIMIFLLIYLI